MSAKTFIPKLVHLLRVVCVYISRYRHTILTHLPETGAAKLDAIVLACEAFIAITPDNEGG